jgi:hypothetical protein
MRTLPRCLSNVAALSVVWTTGATGATGATETTGATGGEYTGPATSILREDKGGFRGYIPECPELCSTDAADNNWLKLSNAPPPLAFSTSSRTAKARDPANFPPILDFLYVN